MQHVPLGAGGNQAAVVETPDLQCTLVLLPGAIPAAAGQTEAIVTVKPLAPSGFGAPPDNRTIGGNVYSIQAQYEPSGQPVTSLTSQSRVLLVYPLTTVGAQHVLLRSQDRGTWTVLPSQDSLAASQLTGTTTTFGYFAAGGTGGASTGAAPVPPSGGGHPLVLWILLGLAAAVAIAVAALGLASRRNARRQSPTPRRRPPPRRPERW